MMLSGLSVTFRALKYPNFRLYFVGQSLSLIGTWMERIAVNWLVYSVTHSALMLGVVNFAGQIPTLLLSPYGGALTDRHSRYKILLITQISAMVQAGIMALLVLTHTYNIAAIIALSIVLGIITAFDTPARQSLMIRLIDDKAHLQNAIALNSSMVNVARLLGPAAAGILLTTVGTGICFSLNALSFVAVIVSLLLMKLKPELPMAIVGSVWDGFKSGYKYLKGEYNMKLMILLMACTSFLTMTYSTLMPVFAKDIFHGDAGTYSALNSLSGLGALIGAIYMASLRSIENLKRVVIISSAICGASIAAVAWCTHLWMALVFIAAGGLGMMIQIAGTNTFIQTNVANEMRGRVLSFYVMAFQGMQPLGSLLAGIGAHHFNPRIILFIQGLSGLVAAILFGMFFKRAADRKIEQQSDQPATLMP